MNDFKLVMAPGIIGMWAPTDNTRQKGKLGMVEITTACQVISTIRRNDVDDTSTSAFSLGTPSSELASWGLFWWEHGPSFQSEHQNKDLPTWSENPIPSKSSNEQRWQCIGHATEENTRDPRLNAQRSLFMFIYNSSCVFQWCWKWIMFWQIIVIDILWLWSFVLLCEIEYFLLILFVICDVDLWW